MKNNFLRVLIYFSAFTSLVVGLLSALSVIAGVNPEGNMAFIATAIFGILAYGIYKKSRICALLAFGFYFAGRYAIFSASQGEIQIFEPIAIGFFCIFIAGIIGTLLWPRS